MTSRQEEREQRLRNNAVLKISRHQPKIVGILHDKEEGCQEGHREGCQKRSQVHAVLKISRHRPKSSASSTQKKKEGCQGPQASRRRRLQTKRRRNQVQTQQSNAEPGQKPPSKSPHKLVGRCRVSRVLDRQAANVEGHQIR